MKRICILLLCFFVGGVGAKDAKTRLLQPLSLTQTDKKQTVEAELAPLLTNKKTATGIKLIGKSLTTIGKQGQTITQFAFGGIERKNKRKKGGRQVVLLKEPAVGAVITKEITQILPEDKIPIQYKEKELVLALDDLLAGLNLAKEPKTFNANNPIGENSSYLQDDDTYYKRALGALNKGLAAAKDIANGNSEDKTSAESRADNLSMDDVSVNKDGEENLTDKTERFNGVGLTPNGAQGGALGQANAMNMPNNMGPNAQAAPMRNGEQPAAPNQSHDNAAEPNAGNGRQPAAGNRDDLNARNVGGFPMGVDPAMNIPQTAGEPRNDLGAGGAPAGQGPQAAANDEGAPAAPANAEPRIEIRSTPEGCFPRVDRIHNKVIIQEKTLRLENDVVVNTSACEDTLENYDIYKDFACEACGPYIDNVRRVAFDKYKAFWINEGDQRVVLDDEPQTDTAEPHPFTEETNDCGYDIDEVLGIAYPKVATVFADRFNGRHVVEACHRSPEAEGFRLTEANCPTEHEFATNRSFLRKKKVFRVGGVKHTASGCARFGQALPHMFITDACQAIVDPHTGAITPLARRRIVTPAGNEFITECEPLADTNLVATTEGCEHDLFSHDFVTGRSYFNKRYYYTAQNGNREYCTNCIRSAEMVAHEYEPSGYQHEDARHISLRKMATFLVFRLLGVPQPQRRIVEPAVRPNAESIPHTLTRTENRATGEPVYNGCHRITQNQIIQHYNRPDGTIYEVVAGLGVPVQGPNECRTEDKHTVRLIGFRSAFPTMIINRVGIRIYPDGRREEITKSVLTGAQTLDCQTGHFERRNGVEYLTLSCYGFARGFVVRGVTNDGEYDITLY